MDPKTQCFTLALAILGAACAPPLTAPHPVALPRLPERAPRPAQVLRVEEGRPLAGPLLDGRSGDFLLENGLVAVVVQGLDGANPGALCDAARAGSRRDALRFLRPLTGRELRGPRLERVKAEELGGAATLRLEGRDAADPGLEVAIEYGLQPGRSELQVVTSIRNRGGSPIRGVLLGDRLDLGAAEPFVPGAGHAIPRAAASQPASAPSLEWPWLGGWTEEVSYLYRSGGGPLSVRPRDGGLETTLASVDLAPGASASASRWLAIGEGGGLQGLAIPPLGGRRGRLEVTVLGDNELLPSGRVEVWGERGLLSEGRADRDGTLQLDLEPGSYRLRALAPGREGAARTARCDADRSSAIRLEAGPASLLVHDLRDQQRGALPVLIAISIPEGRTSGRSDARDDRPPGWRGTRAVEAGTPPSSLHVSATGQGTLPLPPGRYRFVASHGPLHTLHSEVLTLAPGGGASLTARLRRVVDLDPRLLAIDLGQRSLDSPGCAAPAGERVLASRASGLQAVVVGERRRLPRWPKAGQLLLVDGARLAGAGRWPSAAPSSPADADLLRGRLLLFPLAGEHALEAALSGRSDELPGSVFELEELEEARGASDPGDSRLPTVAALRLIDHQPASFEERFDRWLSLLRSGRRVVATGGSSACALARPGGFPRSYLELEAGERSAAAIAAAIRAGRVVASNGPMLRLSVEGKGPGATVAARAAARAPRSRTSPGVVAVRVVVSAPAWIALDELQLYLDGKPWGRALAIPGRADGTRLDQTLEVPVKLGSSKLRALRWSSLFALVRGPRGGMAPIALEARPLALANPVWIDLAPLTSP